jgi:2-dehydro-3-deoxyphosphogluconate aldolase/(4S)-4-hydroxy-2-oxoglutarate aldolase
MQKILERRVVPVVVIEKAEDAVPIAEALVAGGLDVIEITLRTPAALEALRRIVRALPQMFAGAGTILASEQVGQAVDAGAQFGVAPGLNVEVARRASEAGLPFVPGVMTPSEVELAMGLGLKLLKFFPAEPAGGVKMLKALAGPYAHTGVKFLPLGGINAANAGEYLALQVVGAIGGSWLAEKAVVAARDWREITRRTREIIDLAARSGNAIGKPARV